jgi:hypothetical protein
MIMCEEAERCGHGMARSHDHEPPVMTDEGLTHLPGAWAPWGGARTAACADGWWPDEEWSYDLFDLQDSGLVPRY